MMTYSQKHDERVEVGKIQRAGPQVFSRTRFLSILDLHWMPSLGPPSYITAYIYQHGDTRAAARTAPAGKPCCRLSLVLSLA